LKPEHRAGCVEAINAFCQERGFLPLVISSRTADYHTLTVHLRLQGAIVVQPLTHQQVDSYLSEIGPAGESVRLAIGDDLTLWELLDTPLFLNIISAVYASPHDLWVPITGTVEERRNHLFGARWPQALVQDRKQFRVRSFVLAAWPSCRGPRQPAANELGGGPVHHVRLTELERLAGPSAPCSATPHAEFDLTPRTSLRAEQRWCMRLSLGTSLSRPQYLRLRAQD
jgi:hypothetical protein